MRSMKWLKHLPLVVLLILFATGTTLWLLYVTEQRSHLDEVFELETERIADDLVRATLQGDWTQELPAEILGFGLYGPRGEVLFTYGQTPPVLPFTGAGRDGRQFRNYGTYVDFVKRLGLGMGMPREADDDEMERPIRRGGNTLFLRVATELLQSRAVTWNVGALVGPLIWAAFLVFVGLLWHRSRQYQAALVNNRELLQFAEAAKTLSHEIKNPLSAILLQTALLKRSAAAGGLELPSEVVIIEEETQRIDHLVSRVRDFLKDPSGQPEVVDLGVTLAALLERFSQPIVQAGQEEGPWMVTFDPHRLRSVLENLLKNAVESGPAPQPEVRLSSPKTGWVRLEILDRGTGFTPAGLKQASAPFFTTKTQGSGIGLSISDGFVRAAGGTLRWENRPDGGARVWFDLPEAKQHEARV